MWVLFPALAIMAGAIIAVQAAMNAKLGELLKNSILATSIAFLLACLVTLLCLFITAKEFPKYEDISSIPTYLWFGGVLSAFGVGSFYFLIPKMGVGIMMSFALTGQLILAVIASHFGWFDQPVKPMNIKTLIGIILMIFGIILINWSNENGY
ncbi:DMT family transporter [Agaribacter marinus]|uniref:Transporter family-2 protein n=1 Tax=Agaribacter marinus TaxID=1431249 RepID=A0AA37SVF5_9ALTE|nr:DMT family transporter [Agaribacter marinus]GLR70446.1 hypothetical protein GCM10007852_13540 [Agaribacter marinus]